MALATRIIPVLLNKNGRLVKGRRFNHGRVVGHTLQAIRIYQSRGVDELVYLDVTGNEPDIDMVRSFAGECYMPLTVGGGVKTLEHFRQLLANGADKVTINTAAVETPELITAAAEKFGRQAVVVSIDVKDVNVHTHCGKRTHSIDPVSWAKEVEARGAGEILLNSVSRDGTLSGYDLDTVQSVAGAVRVPVIACGGAGSYSDMLEAIKVGAHAVAASAMFHFLDCTPAEAAEYLHAHGIPVRRKLAA